MLRHLSVRNFAIIENIDVSFEEGMNVLTGETGAGKSLLIDAIGLLLGDRADKSAVRSGEKHAEVSGVFHPLNDAIKAELESLDIPHPDDELLIKRRISAKSGNLIKVNDETVTLQTLKRITPYLADIHTQHDTKRLINPDMYLRLLDTYDATIGDYKGEYREALAVYNEALKNYESLKRAREETLEKMDLYRFQAEEIDSHQLEEGEEDTIEARLKTLKNFDEIFQSVKEAHRLLDETGALENTFEASRTLEGLEDYDSEFSSLKERLESAYHELDDIRGVLFDRLNSLDFDPDELERLETRRYTLDTLKRKYHRSIDEIIAYNAEIKNRLEDMDDYDEKLEAAKSRAQEAFEALLEKAEALSSARRKTARSIEETLKAELADLELREASFEIVFDARPPEDFTDTEAFSEDGIDRVDFHLSTNKGEDMKPLRQVASGGELSRIMLALKALLVRQESLNLMIFDEIDSGVSGYVAGQVAKKMASIGRGMQVLAITHLPQVAARASTHYRIRKESDSERTKAHVDALDHENRVRELAEMISSEEITSSALESAEELLK